MFIRAIGEDIAEAATNYIIGLEDMRKID